ncbi:MAG: AI-2E family transporter [Cyanobacteriota bacterium]|nr:AI-2E family transporter [Cyanobacteriota bacterium]
MTFGRWFGLIALVVSLYILWQIRQLVLLLLAAVILANALNLLVIKLQRLGLKRGYAVFISVLLVFSTVVGIFWLILPSFVEQFQQLAILVSESLQQLEVWLRKIEQNLDPRAIAFLPDPQEIVARLQPFVNELVNRGWGIFSNTLGGLLNTLLVLVLMLMILANPTPYRQGLVRLFPSFYRRRADEILHHCDRALEGWLAGILFNMAVIGVLSFVGLLLLGIPLAFSQAILAAFFTLIPNIGPALSVIPPFAIAFLEAPWKPVAVLVLYVGIQQIEGNFLTPIVMQRQVSLLPAMTLISQVIFASVFGFLGLFLALPLTVIGQVLISEILIADVLDPWQKKGKFQDKPSTTAETNLLSPTPEPSQIEPSKSTAEINSPPPSTEPLNESDSEL